MAKVIAVYNKKGGCGKTTTATTLAYLLARCGKRTALIDLDSQGDSSLAYGVPNPDKLQTTILSLVKQVIIGEPLPSPSSYMYSYHGVDLVPSNEEISTLERNLSNVDFREYILKEYISQISPSYDYIIIDCIKMCPVPAAVSQTRRAHWFVRAASVKRASRTGGVHRNA